MALFKGINLLNMQMNKFYDSKNMEIWKYEEGMGGHSRWLDPIITRFISDKFVNVSAQVVI